MINRLGYFETVDNLWKCIVGSECFPQSVAEPTAIILVHFTMFYLLLLWIESFV